jgi:hypothetical protein
MTNPRLPNRPQPAPPAAQPARATPERKKRVHPKSGSIWIPDILVRGSLGSAWDSAGWRGDKKDLD